MTTDDLYTAPLCTGGFTHAAQMLAALQAAARMLGVTMEPEGSRRGSEADQIRAAIIAGTGGDFAATVRRNIAAGE